MKEEEGGGDWERQSILRTKTNKYSPSKKLNLLPESLRDEDDLIFFLGEDAEEGEGLSCLDLLPVLVEFCYK